MQDRQQEVVGQMVHLSLLLLKGQTLRVRSTSALRVLFTSSPRSSSSPPRLRGLAEPRMAQTQWSRGPYAHGKVACKVRSAK